MGWRLVTLGILGILAAGLIAGCGGEEPTAIPMPTQTPTIEPTNPPLPTLRPDPTATPEPTAMPAPAPEPTAMPAPTPAPTATPEPTATSAPTPAPTATPAPTPTAAPTPAGNQGGELQPSSRPPHIFVGTARLNAAPAPVGTAITVMVGTFEAGAGVVEDDTGKFSTIVVPYPNQMATFMVGGFAATQPAMTTMVGGSTAVALTASSQ